MMPERCPFGANNVERSAAEPVEPRAKTKGNVGQAKHAPDSEPGLRVTGAGPRARDQCSCVECARAGKVASSAAKLSAFAER
jgi:hypothetical protein